MAEGKIKTRVFLSYSRADEADAVRLCQALEGGGDVEVLRDKDDILPFEEWRNRLTGLLRSADAVALCLSQTSVESKEVLWELKTAEQMSKRILPVVLRKFETPAPDSVARLNWLDLTNEAAWQDNIERLRTALHTDIGWVREHTRIGELAESWTAGGRRNADLLRGPALEAAESWLASRPPDAPEPTAEQREFITAGRRGSKRLWVAGSLAVAIIALALSGLAYWQRNVAIVQRTAATARQLSAEAQLALADPLAGGEKPARDLLLSLALSPTAAARDALDLAVRRLPPVSLGSTPWPEDAGALKSLRFSPDGRWLGAVTERAVLFWEVPTRRLAFRLSLQAGTTTSPSLEFAEASSHAVVTSGSPDAGGAPMQRVLVDISGGRAEELPSGEMFDIGVIGRDVLALCRPLPAGRLSPDLPAAEFGPCWRRGRNRDAATVLNLVSGETVSLPVLPDGFDLVAEGRFFAARTATQPMFFSDLFASISGDDGDRSDPMLLLMNSKGQAVVGLATSSKAAKPLTLPAGASLLYVASPQGLLAVRTPHEGDIVLHLPDGKSVWASHDPRSLSE